MVTWNVWWRFGPDWRKRQHGLLERLREMDADVIALQECWGAGPTSQAHEFAEQLGLHAAFVAPGLPPAPDSPASPDQVASRSGSACSAAGGCSRSGCAASGASSEPGSGGDGRHP
jgi:Endonuclease/Exonuclease/phosphatase family